MSLGELATHCGPPLVTPGNRHGGQGRSRAMRSFKENQRALLAGQGGQATGSLTGFAGQESLETETVYRQSADGQRGEHRGRARHAGDRDVVLHRSDDQSIAGVRHRRHAGIGHEYDALPGDQCLQQLRRTRRLVAFEI